MTSPRTIAVTSGKGGVGKSSLAIAIGSILARSGRRVTLVDLDLGLANIDILLGLRPRYTLQHLVAGTHTLDEVLVEGPGGLRIVPSGSGIEELANLDEEGRGRLLRHLSDIESRSDVVLFDTAPGISANVVRFVTAADGAVVITTPEATALTDAYALIKVIHSQRDDMDLGVLVNMARSSAEGRRTLQVIQDVARQFLGARVRALGILPYDESVSHAAAEQRSFVEARRDSPAALCLHKAVAELMDGSTPAPDGGRGDYASRLAASSAPALDGALGAAPPADAPGACPRLRSGAAGGAPRPAI